MYTVYVIRGDSGLIYVGHTRDLAKRLVEVDETRQGLGGASP
jgi:predicted GIY-YIG superfamily endonuclease